MSRKEKRSWLYRSLDTHAFLWFIAGSNLLSTHAQELIADPGNQAFLSVASLWEMAIKVSLGKLRSAQPFEESIPQQLSLNGKQILAIEIDRLAPVAPLRVHHRDPFDRLLKAQAMVEGMPVVTADPAFEAYGVQRLW